MADTYIGLAGNPNCGKTTLFNELTGSNGYVGNWPGVTVEKKQAPWRKNSEVTFVDLPGIYSLSPYSPEEVVSRDYLVNEQPDAIINLLDVTNLERNLYLTTQVLEAGRPVVVGLNMCDLLKANGDKIDIARLSKMLGVPVLEVSALRGTNLDKLIEEAISAGKAAQPAQGVKCFTPEVEGALENIAGIIKDSCAPELARWYSVKVFERDADEVKALGLSATQLEQAEAIIKGVEQSREDDSESIITSDRYEWIATVMDACVERAPKQLSTSEKIDKIVTSRLLGIPIFIAIMFLVYYIAISTVGTAATDWVNDNLFADGWEFFGIAMPSIPAAVEGWLVSIGASSVVISLVVEGIVGGVGAVLGFIPQMFVLFVMLSFLEDCGYMSRVAFVMDRVFRPFGLSGKSFIPMLVSSGCGVPGVLATKTIENEKDRRMTAMLTTMVPCGAKQPIIALVMGVLIGGTEGWWIAPMFYFLGLLCIIVSAIMLKKTKPFAGKPTPFVMELPEYHLPSLKSWWLHVWERVSAYIKKAGTIIFAASVGVWVLSRFGWATWAGGNGAFGFLSDMPGAGDDYLDYSLLAYIGNAIGWIFAPLGCDYWQATASSISALIAKENLVSTFGSLYGLGDAGEGDPAMWAGFAQMFTVGGALNVGAMCAYVAFNMLDAPCFAAMGTIRKQMDDPKWFWAAIGYQCGFGWFVGMEIYQWYQLLVNGVFGVWTVIAIVGLALMLFQLFRPMPDYDDEEEKIVSSLEQAA